ncbi:hypothetical protein AMELA_G00211670 [Ameiurus melas]|uniref:Uncharacterized protein n=1 Tax=Ameiurus melas TaxID=219545 RepID=A0A7J6A4H3_AMEME|nr:hypothetical protein AMELA_G00211670 [Ameiurus melas]
MTSYVIGELKKPLVDSTIIRYIGNECASGLFLLHTVFGALVTSLNSPDGALYENLHRLLLLLAQSVQNRIFGVLHLRLIVTISNCRFPTDRWILRKSRTSDGLHSSNSDEDDAETLELFEE